MILYYFWSVIRPPSNDFDPLGVLDFLLAPEVIWTRYGDLRNLGQFSPGETLHLDNFHLVKIKTPPECEAVVDEKTHELTIGTTRDSIHFLRRRKYLAIVFDANIGLLHAEGLGGARRGHLRNSAGHKYCGYAQLSPVAKHEVYRSIAAGLKFPEYA